MSEHTGISWTTSTWNPVIGCDRVSEGCDHCYALTLAARLKAMGNPRYQRDGSPKTSGPGFGVTLHSDVLELPKHWRKPRRIFVNSMSDLFHAEVPERFVEAVWDTMQDTPQHTYQILTKRPRRMASVLNRLHECDCFGGCTHGAPLPNVWLGTSVETQQWADQRIPLLLEVPAAVTFLSCEPLLGPLDLRPYLYSGLLHWVIIGGESGPNYRPMDLEWLAKIVTHCDQSGVSCFVKQDSGPRSGSQGRIPSELLVRQFPEETL